jgi:hypothetical protein
MEPRLSLREGCRHFVQHKSADERAQYPKRVHRLLALHSGALSKGVSAMPPGN